MTPTDKPMTVDALMENTRLAWYLGQRYWQQADSESYAENRRSDLTLEKFNKLLESGRAAIEQYGREQREAAATSKQVEDCVPAPPFDPAAEPPWHRSDMGPAGRGSGEPVAWLPMDTAPKDGRRILLWWGDRVVYGHWLDNLQTSVPWSGWRGPSLEPMRTGQPSHWMPLPGSPNAVPQSREPLTDEQTKALQDVIAERKRQIAVEGWTPEHDDEHAGGDLAEAAACYVLGTADKDTWPWEWEAWKPKDGRSNLVRAAALLLAEIERLDRSSAE